MAEPLSFAASIIAIVQAAQATTQALLAIYNYYDDVKKAPENTRKLVIELKSLEEILKTMKKYGEENKQSKAIQNLNDNLKECSKLLEEFQRKLSKLQKGSKMTKMFRRLKQPFSERETAGIVSQLSSYKGTFNLGLAAENIIVVRDVEAQVQHIAQEQRAEMESRSVERWRKILDWVYTGSTRKKHVDIASRRRKRTGGWILETQEVQNWIRDPDSPIIWGHGIPGSGKTFLSSAIIDYLENEEEFPAAENGVAHIYFDYKEREQQKAVDILSSLVRQLACQLPLPLKELEKLYIKKESKDRKPTTEELFAILLAIFKSFSRVFLVFDALDECDQSEQRKDIIPLIMRMSINKVNVLVTSRPYPGDIQQSFKHAAQLEILAKEEDITIYIEDKINENPEAKRLVELGNCRQNIISELVECAKGMFLLVHFHVKYICEQTSANQILKALGRLRESSAEDRPLDPTYDRAIKTLNNQGKSRKTLAINTISWLVKAQRPMTVDEVRTAVRIEPGDNKLEELDLPTNETLLDVCAGLVMIDKESQTIKFVHYTVQEYIISNNIIPDGVGSHLAVVCITYLLFETFQIPPKTEEAIPKYLESNPFLRYVASHVPFHVGLCENEELVTNLVMDFLRTTGNILSFLKICNYLDITTFEPHREIQTTEELKDWEALCIACHIGHCDSVRILIDRQADLLQPDKEGRTSLYFAVSSGSTATAQLLLNSGAITSTQTAVRKKTPLMQAVINGHLPIVELLLEKGADVSAEDNNEWTALHYAAQKGHLSILQAIINQFKDKGCLELSTLDEGWKAIHLAAINGHLEAIQLLLDNGANILSQMSDGWTALHLAAQNGNLSVVQLLLDKGADVSARDDDGWSVLHAAASKGHLPVVQLLLDKGADVSARKDNGWSPLYTAAKEGHLSTVELLLENGADMSVQDNKGLTALDVTDVESIRKLLCGAGEVESSDSPTDEEED